MPVKGEYVTRRLGGGTMTVTPKNCQQCRREFTAAGLRRVKTASGIVRLMCPTCLARYRANGSGRGRPDGR
jgi:hypothetical protein